MSLSLRASSLPLLHQCSHSLVLLGKRDDGAEPVEVDPYNPLSVLGTAVHAALAHLVDTGADPDFEAVAASCGVDDDQIDELRSLYAVGARVWRKHLAQMFGEAVMTERSLRVDVPLDSGEVFTLTGHLDVSGYERTDAVGTIVDWKSGYVEGDYRQQIMAYALLMLLKYNLRRVRAVVVFLRSQRYRFYEFTSEELEAWFRSEVVGKIVATRRVARPGPACRHCPALALCFPRQRYLQVSITDIAERRDGTDLAIAALGDPLKRKDAAPVLRSLYERAGLIQSTLDRLNQAMRESIEKHGAIDFGDGTRLQLTESELVRIRAGEALPVLREVMDDDELSRCLRVVKGEVEEVVGSHAPRGLKKASIDRVMRMLNDAGAIEHHKSTRMERVDADPTSEEPQ